MKQTTLLKNLPTVSAGTIFKMNGGGQFGANDLTFTEKEVTDARGIWFGPITDDGAEIIRRKSALVEQAQAIGYAAGDQIDRTGFPRKFKVKTIPTNGPRGGKYYSYYTPETSDYGIEALEYNGLVIFQGGKWAKRITKKSLGFYGGREAVYSNGVVTWGKNSWTKSDMKEIYNHSVKFNVHYSAPNGQTMTKDEVCVLYSKVIMQ